MIRLARGARCGPGRTPANGFDTAGFPSSAKPWRRSPVSATPPSPNPKRPKKSRRFISKLMCVLMLTLHDGFVEVQKRARDDRTGRKIDRRNLGIIGFIANSQETGGFLFVLREDRLLLAIHLHQQLQFR